MSAYGGVRIKHRVSLDVSRCGYRFMVPVEHILDTGEWDALMAEFRAELLEDLRSQAPAAEVDLSTMQVEVKDAPEVIAGLEGYSAPYVAEEWRLVELTVQVKGL